MYTFLVGDDNVLQTSVQERIMQRSKLVDNLHFLVEPVYKEQNMADFTVMLEYLTPVGHKYRTRELIRSDDLYKEMLEYKIPADTDLTDEAGDVELQLSFYKVEMQDDGTTVQYVRKTEPGILHIVAISAWSDLVPDSTLTAVDQRMIKMEALMNEMLEANQNISDSKADNLSYVDNMLQLTAKGEPIGDKVKIPGSGTETEDGTIRVVEF